MCVSIRSTVVESDEIPAEVLPLAKEKRTELIEQLADVDEEMCELFLEEKEPTVAQLEAAIRRSTIALKFSPVFLGSAIKNTAVQPMLDGVCAYLPNPSEAEVVAHDTSLPISAPPVPLTPAADAPLVALAFKLEESRFGQLTYMRVYQGSLRKGAYIFHARTGKKVKVPRLVRMHSNEMEVSKNRIRVEIYLLRYICSRTSIPSVRVRFAPSSVLSVRRAILSRMDLHRTLWHVPIHCLITYVN